jgi:hypothetical protein
VPGIVGGVIGAVLAVFGAPLVQGPPPLAPEPAARLATVESDSSAQAERLAAIDEQVAGLQTTFQEQLEPTVQSAVEAAVAEVPSRDGVAIAALGERLARATSEMAALQTALDALDSRVTAESGRLDAAHAELRTALESRIDAEAARIDETRESASGAVAEAREAASGAPGGGGGGGAAGAGGAARGALAEARSAIGEEIGQLRGTLESAQGEIASIQGTLESVQQARGRAAAAALLARDIDRSIDSGAAFEEPLERLIAMSGDDPELETSLTTLRPYAAAGVPTVATLRADLAALAESSPPTVAGSEWLGQTVENITGLVTVRDKDSDAEVATGRLADADQALRDGDVEAAIAIVEEVAAMPEGIDPAAAEAWLADARAQVTAVAAQQQLDAHIRELLTATVN